MISKLCSYLYHPKIGLPKGPPASYMNGPKEFSWGVRGCWIKLCEYRNLVNHSSIGFTIKLLHLARHPGICLILRRYLTFRWIFIRICKINIYWWFRREKAQSYSTNQKWLLIHNKSPEHKTGDKKLTKINKQIKSKQKLKYNPDSRSALMKFNSSYIFSCLCLQIAEFPHYDASNNNK